MFTFTDDYKIGIKQIDEEHEQLVALINGTEKMLAENNTELHVLAKNFHRLILRMKSIIWNFMMIRNYHCRRKNIWHLSIK